MARLLWREAAGMGALMLLVARHATPLARSPIPSVATDAEWTDFVDALTVQPVTATSERGGIGCFDLRPSRLAELGIMNAASLRREKLAAGGWYETGEFSAPWSRERFHLEEQGSALGMSMAAYLADIESGRVALPVGVSHAGGLAILHRGRRAALSMFPKLLSDTQALYERAKDCFK